MTMVLITLLLSSCFPIYKQTQPELKIDIFDEQGKAIKDVELILYTVVSPAKKEFDPLIELTNENGRADFKEARHWAVESLIIHGRQNYSWSMCVKKQNFVSQYIPNIQNGYIKVILLEVGKKRLKSDAEHLQQEMISMVCIE